MEQVSKYKLLKNASKITSSTCTTSENVLNNKRNIQLKTKFTKNVDEKMMKSIKSLNRMDAKFMNSKYSKSSDPHRILVNI